MHSHAGLAVGKGIALGRAAASVASEVFNHQRSLSGFFVAASLDSDGDIAVGRGEVRELLHIFESAIQAQVYWAQA